MTTNPALDPLAPPAGPARATAKSQTNARKLVVGREIVFSGEITSCDCLVVEGTVKANVAACDEIQIAEGGLFTGSASVANAEIRGRFEGELTVSGCLTVRSSGKISGKLRYHQIEVERGGQISGEIQAQEAGKPAAGAVPIPLRA
jgi:cytoskeletal protein CcmA (bactofilin family)